MPRHVRTQKRKPGFPASAFAKGSSCGLLLDKVDVHLALERLLQRDLRLGRGDALDTQDTVENRTHEVLVVHAVEFHEDVARSGDEMCLHDFGDLLELFHGLLEQLRVFERDADETGLLEGSRMIKHNGKYYLLMISWPQGHPRREVCYRADKIMGPYEKKVILETEFAGFNGVGQGTIVDDKDGNWYGIVFQDRGGVGRVLTLEPCTWKDGWPMLTDEKGNIPAEMQKPVLGYDGKGLVYSDDFSKDKLELQWQWNHNPVDNAWSLTERKGWLRLKTSRVVPNIFLAPNTISTRTEGPACEGIIKMDVSKMKDGDVAGLSAFQGDAALLSIVKEGKKLFVVGTKESVALTDKEKAVTGVKREVVYRQPLNLKVDKATKSSIIYLKMSCDFRLHQDLATLFYSIDGKTWIPAIKDFKMQYDYRRFFMGTRIAIYNYATKAAGGYIDVDSFEYSKRK